MEKIYCPHCREKHAPSRKFSYDGFGVNTCGMYRDRVADIPKEYRHLGPLFASAPELLARLKNRVENCQACSLDICADCAEDKALIEKADGL